jgi:hypothetical protein
MAERVYRITLNPRQQQRLQRIREVTGTGSEFQAALDFLNAEFSPLGPATLADLLRLPFEREPFRPARFSNGAHPVLYTALEWETAGEEYSYWAPKLYGDGSGTPFRIRLHLISCRFEGATKDVRPFHADCPWLTEDTYDECQRLGAAAKAEGLDGLLSPSARRLEGTTVPIFSQSSVSNPAEEREVIFVIEPNAPYGARAVFS